MGIGSVLASLLSLYVLVLFARLVLDYVLMFSRSWTPTGFMLVVVDFVFRLTDPPLRALRRFIPPLRLGQVSLDLSFIVLIIGLQILIGIVRTL